MKTTKVICISTGVFIQYLELHKIYEGFYDSDSDPGLQGWYIDRGGALSLEWFPIKCFITLAEWREKQINSVLDDN